MNRKLLQKVIDELAKENPKLDYIRGILETLIESLPEDKPTGIPFKGKINTNDKPIDDAALIEMGAQLNKVDLGSIKTE